MLSTKQLIICMLFISARQLLLTAWLVKVLFSLCSSVYLYCIRVVTMVTVYSWQLNSISLATHATTYTTGKYIPA